MPSRTRANQRIMDVLNEEAINTPLPPTPRIDQKERPPLGVLSVAENEQLPIAVELNFKTKKPNRKKKIINKENLHRPEVLEDEYESSSSSAVEEVRRVLRSGYPDNFVSPYLDCRPQTPPSRAVKAARRRLSPKSPARTPRFDPDIHTLPPSARRTIQDDSFVAYIESRSPVRMESQSSIVEVVEDENVATPGLAAMITPVISRGNSASPKRSPRIEDSVHAIDALAEALEELETALPIIPMDDKKEVSFKAASESPQPKITANTTKKRVASAPLRKKPIAATVQSQTTQSTVKKGAISKTSAKFVGSRQSLPAKTVSARVSLPAPRTVTKPMNTPKAQTPAPRVVSITKAPFVPAKSTKTPTRSTFTLPGDVITARKKAAHEAKLKQEEEEKKAKREFKARPVPSRVSIGSATVPRPTIASQQRKSLAKGLDLNASKKPASTPKVAKVAPRTQPVNNRTTQVTKSTVKVASRPSIVGTKTFAKPAPAAKAVPAKPTSAQISRTTRGPVAKPIRNSLANVKPESRPMAAQRSVKPKATVSSTASLVAPTKLMTDKEKAEAAKKARAEAAAKGREASRLWAQKERQKRQSLAAATAVTKKE